MTERLMTPLVDRDSAPYWKALADGRFELQHCRRCGHWNWPPRPVCSGCLGTELAWEQPQGTGTVYSWVVTHQVYGRDWAPLVPYTIALVRLDEQHDLLVPAILRADVEVKQGLHVRAVAERIDDEVGLLYWEVDQG
jgi:uncharacterized OB-fold protein